MADRELSFPTSIGTSDEKRIRLLGQDLAADLMGKVSCDLGGRLVNLGSAAGATAPVDSAALRSGSLSLLGYTNNDLTVDQRADAVSVIAEHVHAGRLTLDYEAVPLTGIGEAWSRQSAGRADRRLVVVP